MGHLETAARAAAFLRSRLLRTDVADGVELIARSEEVHARYCTPPLAKALAGASVTVSRPPLHQRKAIRVLEEKPTGAHRVAITTAQGRDDFVFRHRYVLDEIDGEWRFSSHRALGMVGSEDRA